MSNGAEGLISIVIINPNSSQSMTTALEPILANLTHPALSLRYHTGPDQSPPSVNDSTTSVLSAAHTFASLQTFLGEAEDHQVDAFLVACFSDHPLVGMLREHTTKPVLGIFEASIMHALALGRPFGVVTTGQYWEAALTDGVRSRFGSADLGGAFVGVESTGMSALELHEARAEIVTGALGVAAAKIVGRGARTIIMGCAGMSGMERAIRGGCAGEQVVVVDAVRSGVTVLEGLVRAMRD
ncbi:Asp/Glu/hydantoin racemase [Epithele typhae]|uniref:Asp/Glu/hydantoin racemase n=1 Tax=Epithele typhae TaxID=378194 RepID=UPI002008495F|nr:Asp/Glu/hydantoin racemase [Epithele typhae]KAH9935202.1 Asp/Glu/hydantoin racemase [Epithele typhae]